VPLAQAVIEESTTKGELVDGVSDCDLDGSHCQEIIKVGRRTLSLRCSAPSVNIVTVDDAYISLLRLARWSACDQRLFEGYRRNTPAHAVFPVAVDNR